MRIGAFGPGGFVVAVALAAILSACSSGSDGTQAPKISSVVAERDVVDGKAKLTSTLELKFDRDWELADTNLPFASLFELKVPLADGTSKRVLIQTAARSETNDRLVTLTVKDLVPEGSVLTVQRKAFDRKATGTISHDVESDLDAALALLASRALVVTNESFYDDPVTAPVSDADADVAVQRSLLDKHLRARQASADVIARALATYDSMPGEIVPAPKLRAALAGLTGTFAEAAINSFITAENCTRRPVANIDFRVPPGKEDLVAQVTFSRGSRVVSVNPFAQGERFEYLMPILAHEAIHCDEEAGIVEEVAATAFDGFLYLQLIAVDAELASGRTRVARELNIDAVAMINSGQRYPESIGILPSPGVRQVLPLTTSNYGSFAELVANAYRTVPNTPSPPESVAVAYVQSLARATGMEPGNPFDLAYLDELLSRAVDPGVFAMAIDVFELVPEG